MLLNRCLYTYLTEYLYRHLPQLRLLSLHIVLYNLVKVHVQHDLLSIIRTHGRVLDKPYDVIAANLI